MVPRNLLAGTVKYGFLPSDDADMRLKKVALVLVVLIGGTAAFFWSVIYMLLGYWLSGFITISYVIVSGAGLLYFFRTQKTGFMQVSQLLLVLLLPFLLMWSLGGFAGSGMLIIWAILSPIAALMSLGKRDALMWFLAYLALIMVSVLIDAQVAASTPPLPEDYKRVFYFLNLALGSAGLYLLVSYPFNEEKLSLPKGSKLRRNAFFLPSRDALPTRGTCSVGPCHWMNFRPS